MADSAPRKGSYGFDAAYVPAAFAALGAAEIAATVWAVRRGRRLLAAATALGAAWCATTVAGYVYTSLRGKFDVWTELLDELRLEGDEQVLDVGCGRGAVLIDAARRLSRGRAVGVDVWRAIDQVGNARATAELNAEVEGVAERVELVDADARSIPFPDGSFDVVLSSMAFHNIDGPGEVAAAVRESVRVLRPGGRLRIVDLRSEQLLEPLQAAGCVDVQHRELDWRFAYGSPYIGVALVAARKPS